MLQETVLVGERVVIDCGREAHAAPLMPNQFGLVYVTHNRS